MHFRRCDIIDVRIINPEYPHIAELEFELTGDDSFYIPLGDDKIVFDWNFDDENPISLPYIWKRDNSL
jgi:hypothetical protein